MVGVVLTVYLIIVGIQVREKQVKKYCLKATERRHIWIK